MGRKDSTGPGGIPSSRPPETREIDSSWDGLALGLDFPTIDEFAPELSDSGDRITAIPDMPMSDLARDLMAATESDPGPEPLPGVLGPGKPTLKESLSSPQVPRFDPRVMPGTAPGLGPLEFEPESVGDNWGRLAKTPPDPDEFGPLVGGAGMFLSPTEPPPSEDPIPDTSRSPFDFDDDAPPRHELPTLDISEGVDDVLGGGLRRERSGLDLASEPPPAAVEDPAGRELRDRYAVGDFTGALVIAESILELDGENLEAKRYAQSCRDVLMQMYAARLGSLDQVVSVAIPPDQIRWLSLDHRAGFLLSLVDGYSSVDELLDICGMPRLDALRIMYQLLEQRVIAVG